MNVAVKSKSVKEYIIKYNDLESYTDFFKILPKLKRKAARNNKIGIEYKNNILYDDSQEINELKDLLQIITALNIKNKKERYEYIYDTVCDYLDNEFKNNNYCDFKCNQCTYYRNMYPSRKEDGCCFSPNVGLCKYLINHRCTIKSISCKLHVCQHLKKQGVHFKINDIPLLKHFFNIRQKTIIGISFFTDKEEVINRLVRLV
ncbi:MAG: hypothetical protein PHS45_01520 [Bacilli bacterium]|nr:hypothetical protein [Bacilli bacterium]